MIDKKEQFMLSLKGWTYKGILDDWYHGPDGPGYSGSIRNTMLGIRIPANAIDTKGLAKDGSIIIYLKNYNYYVLGNRMK